MSQIKKNNCPNCNKTITDFFDDQTNSYDKIKSFYKWCINDQKIHLALQKLKFL